MLLTRSAGASLSQQVYSILQKYGTDAHVYLPGIGVINGLTAGNYLDSAGTTAATVDNPVGLVLDAGGAIDATQATAANQPILRKGAVNLCLYSSTLTNAAWVANVTKLDAETVSSAGGQNFYQTIAVTPNTTYAFTWEAKLGTGNTLWYAVYNNTGAAFIFAETSYAIAVNSSEYSRVGVRFTTPSGCVSIRAYPLTGNSAAGTYNFKNHMITTAPVKNGVAIGDSFTSDAIYTVQASLTSATPITNKGTSGNKLAQMQARFAADVVALAPQYVVIQGGINDIANAVSDPVSGMQTQIETMVGQARDSGITPIICNTSPWGTYTSWTAQKQAYQDTYNAWLSTYCATNSITMVDIYTALQDPDNPLNLLAAYDSGDHLHPSTAGYKVMGLRVADSIGLPDFIIAPTTTAPASNLVGGYHWVADSTDLLTATYPAGYESATIVNALSGGQSTLTAQNIVGSYSIGPSVDTYGRIIFKAGCTASELAIIQQYANRLVGV
jgi:lysophospholipase L1-like esterase